MPDDPGRETLAMLARVLADPGNVSRDDVLALVAFAQAAAECANEAEAKLAAVEARLQTALASIDDIDPRDTLRRAVGRARRYDQCDDSCTVDCGHCKGDAAASGRVRAALAETDDDLRIERWSQQVPIKPCFMCWTPKRIDSECNATPECIEVNRAERERRTKMAHRPATPQRETS